MNSTAPPARPAMPQPTSGSGALALRRAGNSRTRPLWPALLVACAWLVACGKPSPSPSAVADGASGGVGAVAPHQPQASPVAAAPAPAERPSLRSGEAPPTLPDGQLVDVLLKIPAPLLSSPEVDAAARPALRELKSLPGVEAVFSRATSGELRVVVRTSVAERAGVLGRVLGYWQAHAPADFGPAEAAAIARGARARVAWAVTDAATEIQTTAAVAASQASWAAALGKASRLHMAGAAVPAFHLDVLTRTAAENRLTLQDVVDKPCAALTSLPAGPALQDRAEDEALLHQQLTGVLLPRRRLPGEAELPAVPAPRVLALRRALAIAPRPALVGRNPVLLVMADGGGGADTDGLMAQESAARRAPATRAKLTPAGQLLPQTVDAAQRFILQLRPGERPESAEGMAQRLLAVRDIPNIVSALAVRGWDGIPANLDSAAEADQRWTVWLTPSGGKIEESLRAARDILDRGPWQAVSIAANLDTALAWMVDQPAAAGLLVSAADAALVSSVAGVIGSAAQRSTSLQSVTAGPSPRPANGQFGRIDAQLARQYQLSAGALTTALAMLQGGLYCGEVRGAALWFGLPQGEMAAEQGRLPLGWLAAPQPGASAAVDLALVQRLPSQEPLLDRLRVNDKPSLYLLANSSAGAAIEAILAVRDAVERQGSTPGVQLTSLTVKGALQDQPSCVP